MPLEKVDKYCHQCGQLNSTKRLALIDFFKEFVSNVFSYDGRGWRTIKHILFKPGFVSKEFIRGKRMSYANPFRFFLSVCIVFFLLVQVQQTIDKYSDDGAVPTKENNTDDNQYIEFDLGEDDSTAPDDENSVNEITDAQLEQIEQEQLGGRFIANKIREERDKDIKTTYSDSTKTKKKNYHTQAELDKKNWIVAIFEQLDDYTDFYHIKREPDPEIALKELEHRTSNYNKVLYERAILLETIEKDPSMLAAILLPKLPLFLFLFTPLITLFLWLFYVRRSFNYMEHLIFSFNVMTFVFLSSIIFVIVKWITLDYIDLSKPFFFLIGPFYLYKSMRNFYGQGRIKTFLKFLLISFVYAISLSIGFLVLLLLGIAFY